MRRNVEKSWRGIYLWAVLLAGDPTQLNAEELRDAFRRVKSSVVVVKTAEKEASSLSGWLLGSTGLGSGVLISDAAINIAPDLKAKVDIVQNAIDLARVLGIELPRVAILSAVETVNPEIPSTLDAAALCKMAQRGQITGGLLDGPLAFDNAISELAAKTKKIASEVAGKSDVLIAPDIEAGNMLVKQLQYLAGADAAGIVLGARVPIVLTSRADTVRNRLASTAVLVRVARGNELAELYNDKQLRS